MIDSPASRREALRRAALAGGALAAGSLLDPTAALAQSVEDEDLRDFLVEAVGLEHIAVLAYAAAADASEPELTRTLEGFRDQEQAHANALQTALESIGFEAPDEPADSGDTTVYEDAPFADESALDEIAERLTGHLEGLESLSELDELLDYAAKLEREQLRLYLSVGVRVDSEDLATTAAEIAGCQAQHLVVLETELGANVAKALQAASEAARIAGAPATAPAE